MTEVKEIFANGRAKNFIIYFDDIKEVPTDENELFWWCVKKSEYLFQETIKVNKENKYVDYHGYLD